MNWKKFIIAFVVTFVFIFLFGFVWHGKLMDSSYTEVASLWRDEADFNRHFSILILGHVVLAFFFTLIYASFVPAGGPSAGVRLGIMVALLCTGSNVITFAVQPITTKILCFWIVGDLLMFSIAGAIIGAIYKPGSSTAT